MPERFFDDPSRRRYSLFFLASTLVLGALFIPLSITSAIQKDDSLFGFTLILVYFASVLTFQAIIAEYYFSLSMIEHLQAWVLPIAILFNVLFLFLSRWIHPVLLAVMILLPWDAYFFVLHRWTHDIMKKIGEHPYLFDGFLDSHRKLLPSITLGVFITSCALTVVLAATI